MTGTKPAKPISHETEVFVSQLDRKIHAMWHDGESREAALAEARDRLLAFGGVRPYLRNRWVAWATRRPTDRSAQSCLRDAYGPQGCTPGQLPCGPAATANWPGG